MKLYYLVRKDQEKGKSWAMCYFGYYSKPCISFDKGELKEQKKRLKTVHKEEVYKIKEFELNEV